MGIIKKIFKGIKKVFKKIGRGIKKAFKAFGKFMGKIGFVGQMAMMFLFPAGIGSLLTKGLTKLGTSLASVGAAGSNNILVKAVQGVGQVLNKTSKFISTAKKGFSSITNGLKEFGKTALSKVGIKLDGAASNFFGENSAWSKTQEGFAEVGDFARGMKEGSINISKNTNIKDLANQTGITQADLKRINPSMVVDKDGIIKFDSDTFSVNVDTVKPLAKGIDQETVQNAILEEPTFSKNLVPEERTGIGSNNSSNAFKPNQDIAKGVQELPDIDESIAQTTNTKQYSADRAFKNSNAFRQNRVVDETVTKVPVEDINTIKGAVEGAVEGKDTWFSRGWSKTTEAFKPSEVGFLKAGQNIASTISTFMPEDEVDYGNMSKGLGLIDLHTGYAGYTPPQDFNMFQQQGGGTYGYPALGEQLQLFKMYNPFEDSWLYQQQQQTQRGL